MNQEWLFLSCQQTSDPHANFRRHTWKPWYWLLSPAPCVTETHLKYTLHLGLMIAFHGRLFVTWTFSFCFPSLSRGTTWSILLDEWLARLLLGKLVFFFVPSTPRASCRDPRHMAKCANSVAMTRMKELSVPAPAASSSLIPHFCGGSWFWMD